MAAGREGVNCFNSFCEPGETVETVCWCPSAAATSLKRGVSETTLLLLSAGAGVLGASGIGARRSRRFNTRDGEAGEFAEGNDRSHGEAA